MNNIIKTKKGFTLVELVIVIVIVGILSIVSVPIYRGYVEKAMITEGKVLLSAIGKAELAYHVKNDCFLEVRGSYSKDLDIDASGNKYFTRFRTQAGVGSQQETENAMALAAVYAAEGEENNGDEEYVDIWVYGTNSNNNKGWTLHAKQWANGALHGDNDDIDVSPYLPK